LLLEALQAYHGPRATVPLPGYNRAQPTTTPMEGGRYE